MTRDRKSAFEKAAAEERSSGFLAELWTFIKTNKKWWLIPILVVFLILGSLILLAGSGVAPFIYTLF